MHPLLHAVQAGCCLFTGVQVLFAVEVSSTLLVMPASIRYVVLPVFGLRITIVLRLVG